MTSLYKPKAVYAASEREYTAGGGEVQIHGTAAQRSSKAYVE